MRTAFSLVPTKWRIFSVCLTQRKNSSIAPLVEVGDVLGGGLEIVAEDAQDLAGLDPHRHLAHRRLERVPAAGRAGGRRGRTG
jgi:hypothetical protein